MMQREDFNLIVTEYICPILTGAEVVGIVESSTASDLVTIQANGQTIHIRPDKNSDYKVAIRRSQIFKKFDTNIVKSVVREICLNYHKVDAPYRERVIYHSTEVGICKYISPANYNVLFDILDGFDRWAIRTYEGRRVTFSFIVDFDNLQESSAEYPAVDKMLEQDFCALLSNSVKSCLVISAYGALLGYLNTFENQENNVYSPLKYNSFANYADGDKVCLTLTNNGETLIFQNKKILFSKRGGIWNYYNHLPVVTMLSGDSTRVGKSLKNAIYETLLDVSFSRTGGCIALVHKKDVERIKHLGVIKEQDLVDQALSIKSQSIKCLLGGRKFQALDRVLRTEILGIDGAVIIDYRGHVISVGAIIKIGAGSSGGGRLAATKTLSEYGSAIKISADGMVQAFAMRNGKMEELFSFG